ncbi:aldehyde ferredoxin oxidoreductase family protein [Halalkalirubrum salinum]|uniref:aldehyde ferredoxin oxidoreductase family protein n=1 Tax=Halalkalirubrum salinum TaxID=2563889 RepID=UPI0010FB43ED|nr:aldehyde ferredoxin oxidoreductase C-terminal domain-containing protein [Halalkalirubrum salinum]
MDDPRRDHVLSIDLTTGSVDRIELPERWLRDYLGGKGLGARYLYEHLAPETNPQSPANVIGFVLGPLSGYLPGQSRYAVVTKSPLTGTFLDSYSGGSFPDRLAGSLQDCLALFVTGKADEPVKIVVSNGDARIEPAETWGLDTVETDEAYTDAATACIGPAGEHGVVYATIASDGGDHHAGRGGAGAVMGSKRLKAVVAADGPPVIPPEIERLHDRLTAEYVDHDTGKWQAAAGTMESVDFANEVGHLATEGWQRDRFEAIDDIGIEAIKAEASSREDGDEAIPGDFYVETHDGSVVLRGAAPMTLGAGLGITDLDGVATLGEACDRLGMDVIDAGNAVAWAIRAADDDLIDARLSFGDVDAAKQLLGAIAVRDTAGADSWPADLPAVLADGVAAAGETYGGDSFIPTIKSMALPSYDPRGTAGMALAYATSDRGACHRRARPIETEAFAGTDWSIADRVETVVGAQTVRSTLWSLVIDDFVGEAMWDTLGSEWLEAIGRSYTTEELTRVGERIWTLVRLFNAREGFDRRQDRLPAPLREPATGTDRPAIDPNHFDTLLDAYYAARGWGPNGLPTPETLDRLGLGKVVDSATPIDDSPVSARR